MPITRQPKDYADESYELKDLNDKKKYSMTIRVLIDKPTSVETICKNILSGAIPISELNISSTKNGTYYE